MNLNELALKVHPKILDNDKVFMEHSKNSLKYLNSVSEQKKVEIQNNTLFERFNGFVDFDDCVDNELKENYRRNGSGKSQRKKSKKEKRMDSVPTYIITGDLLKESLSIEVIAEKRELSADTIIGHIEKLQTLKKIDNNCIAHLKTRLPACDLDILFSELKKSEDGKLKPIYEKFEGKYSYGDIKLARLFFIK